MKNAKIDDTLDMSSWPVVKNRRDLICSPLMRETGKTFYTFTGSLLIFSIWCVFCLLSKWTTFSKSDHLSDRLWTIGGLASTVCIRGGFMFAEETRATKSMEYYTRSLYIQSFYSQDHRPDTAGNGWSSVQFKAWHVILAMIFAVSLVLLGALVPSQRWALWVGCAIPTEIITRLVIELLWRKTKLGNVVETWLKKRGWW